MQSTRRFTLAIVAQTHTNKIRANELVGNVFTSSLVAIHEAKW